MPVVITNDTPWKKCDSCGRTLYDSDVSCLVCEAKWRLEQ